MTQSKTYFLLLSLFLSFQLASQHVVVQSGGKPLSGVIISIHNLDSVEKRNLISDINGIVQIDHPLPYVLTARYLGYKTFQDTVYTQERTIIQLISNHVELENIVITGQYTPQSAQNSVYNIRTFDSDRIQKQAAVNLQDVLSLETNIRFSRDNATGTSGIKLQGLSGQYVKVLIDGIPVVGRAGTGNEIDIDQIDISNIERVEIIEGPMSVTYGADALAGVINIITKKSNKHKLSLDLGLHEETIGSEYSLFSDGIHNPSIKISGRLNSNWAISANSRTNHNGGWEGTRQNQRGKNWYPRKQHFYGGIIQFGKGNFDAFYKLDQLNQTILNEDSVVNDSNPLKDPIAFDQEYLTERWNHQFQSELRLPNNASWQLALSYTDYERITHNFRRNLTTQQKTSLNKNPTQFKSFFLRSTLNNALQFQVAGSVWTTQIGIDTNLDRSSGSTLSEGEKSINDFGFFGSTEIKAGEKLKIRPGFRLTYNSVYESSPTSSINLKFIFNPLWQIRTSYGRGYRAPAIRELFYQFIDTNHNIIGNTDLIPETSHSINTDLSYTTKNKLINAKINGFYNHIDNQITFLVNAADPSLPTTMTNLLQYKTTGISISTGYSKKKVGLNIGFSHIGRYQRLSEESKGNVPQFVFGSEFTANTNYHFEKENITISAFYKFTGTFKEYRNITNPETNEDSPVLSTQNSFHWLNANISKDFDGKLTIGTGVRNIFDITSVQNNGTGGGVHGGSSDGQSVIANGRSYFIKLNYHFHL